MKRHRRRDSRYQYRCLLCKQYFTEETKLKHIKYTPDYYDKFIADYSKSVLKSEKPNIAGLCLMHNLSRASVYRHLLQKDKKILLDTVVDLQSWAKSNLDGLYKREIYHGSLRLTHQSIRKDLVIEIAPFFTGRLKNIIVIKGKFNSNISRFIPTYSSIAFASDNRSFSVKLVDTQYPLSQHLHSLRKILVDF